MLRIMCVLCAVCLLSGAAHAASSSDKLKAVFIYKFFKYVTWPESNEPYKICLKGKVQFKDVLQLIQEKQKKVIPTEIIEINDIKNAQNCHILFFNNLQKDELTGLKDVLTISDKRNFIDMGGMIQLLDNDKKVELVVNLSPIQKSQLKISSRLLDVAKVER